MVVIEITPENREEQEKKIRELMSDLI